MPGFCKKNVICWTIASTVNNPITPYFTKRRRMLLPNRSHLLPQPQVSQLQCMHLLVPIFCWWHTKSWPKGIVQARALLDIESSASFVNERLAEAFHLRRFTQKARICGIAGIPHSDGKQEMTQFLISSAYSPGLRYNVNAFIVSQITGNQPVYAVSLNQNCKYIQGLSLADPDYNKPGKIDILPGVDIFNEVIHHGWWSGPHSTPTALNTEFRWVLAGSTGASTGLNSLHLSYDWRWLTLSFLGGRREDSRQLHPHAGGTICIGSLQFIPLSG